jgi:cell division protein FtsW (lipid II flippase)
MRGVIRHRSNMTKRIFLVVLLATCVISHAFVYFHFVHTGDTVAGVFGYFTSLVIIPLLAPVIVAFGFMSAIPHKFSKRQKWTLLLFPVFTLAALLVYFYVVLQYGGPH